MSAFDAVNIGRRIAQARKEAGGMTQEELSDLLAVTTRSVQGYEAGDVVPWKHFQRLEAVFNRPLEWFLHGDPDRPSAEDWRQVSEQVAGLGQQLARIERLLDGTEAAAD